MCKELDFCSQAKTHVRITLYFPTLKGLVYNVFSFQKFILFYFFIFLNNNLPLKRLYHHYSFLHSWMTPQLTISRRQPHCLQMTNWLLPGLLLSLLTLHQLMHIIEMLQQGSNCMYTSKESVAADNNVNYSRVSSVKTQLILLSIINVAHLISKHTPLSWHQRTMERQDLIITPDNNVKN
jgi:hypothetical protein